MKQVRIIDFLRDCPLYTRLYSPLYGYCEFLECSRNFIFVRVSKSDPKSKRYSYITYKFNESGKPCGRIGEENEIDTSECMLFPSHTYKSWKNWQAHLFKDGDIIVENTADVENRNMFKYKRFDVCYGYNGIPFIVPPSELKNYRYATKEEQIQFKELQEKFEKDNNDLKETIEITNNIIKAQAKTWGRLHPAYELAENMGLLDDGDKEVMPKIIEAEKKNIEEANTKATDKMFHTNDIIIDRTFGIDYLHLFRVDGYNSAGRCWFCYDSEGTRYALTQDEINKYEYATEQEIADFKNLQEKFEKDNEKKTIDYSKFYYIKNTAHTDIMAYCKTMCEALERLKDYRDWYDKIGTWEIYEVEFGKSPIGKLIYNKE